MENESELQLDMESSNFTPPDKNMQGIVQTDGYEWINHGGHKWYRVANVGAEWTRWQ
jgi:hypothetical protein